MKSNDKQFITSPDKTEPVKSVLKNHKNIVICGIQGVGKIYNVVSALKDKPNVYILQSNVDYEGKFKEIVFTKYIEFLRSIKEDIQILPAIDEETKKNLLASKEPIYLVIDGLYGRAKEELSHIYDLIDAEHITLLAIVRCLNHLRSMITQFDIVLELTHDGALYLSVQTAELICQVLSKNEAI